MIEHYMILEEKTIKELEYFCTKIIKTSNFRPQGGVCYAKGKFYQAMVYEDPVKYVPLK